MVLAYEPGDTYTHRLDPRTKLALQAAYAAAAFAHTTPEGLVVLTALALGALALARLRPLPTLWSYRVAFPVLLAAPLLEGVRLAPPWFAPAAALEPALASYRVVLLLLVSAAYVHTTAARESRAAVQRLVPGKGGRLLGAGVALVVRFLPVLRDDLVRTRRAVAARLGSERPVHERIRIVGVAGLARAFERADRLSLALRARCFAWNPTLPALAFARRDLPALALAVALVVWAVV